MLRMMDDRVTQLLHDFAGGNKAALDQLIPMFYDELRKMADGFLRNERPGHTLQPTALVHEFYSRMLRQKQPDYQGRAHFLGIAARAMRQILIDHARGKNAGKRGSGEAKCTLQEALDAPLERPSAIIAVDDALQALEKLDAHKARLIEMRFFGGLTAEESAEALQMNVHTVRNDLRLAQAWLQRELDRTGENA